MSLINDALKKVQRQHGHEPQAPLPVAPGAPAVQSGQAIYAQRRGNPPATQMLILIGAGAAVLVVLSVIITVVLVNRKPEPSAIAATGPTPVLKSSVDLDAPSPVIVAPAIALPAALTGKSAPGVASPASVIAPAPVVVTPETPAATPTLVVNAAPDPRIITFVDAIRVTGIKSSGNESKVMMNDKIFRVNDVVERLMGIKLIKVEPEMLTFSDEHGVIYTKTF